MLMQLPWLALLLCSSAGVEPVSAKDIVDRSLEHNAFGVENATAQIELTIVNKRGKERVRIISVRSAKLQQQDHSLIRFETPADVAGTGFLVVAQPERADDQFLYLPALGKVKRISSSQRNQQFMGTDLTYADLESKNLEDSTLKRLADGKVGSHETYVIESIPKDESKEYGKTISWIHKTSFVPLKVKFYDRKLDLLKTLTTKELKKRDGRWVVMRSVINNAQKNSQTKLRVLSLDLTTTLGPHHFTQRALAND
jgi:outer membrane lipoprotein-sorting protein